jgi:hypothetical protein
LKVRMNMKILMKNKTKRLGLMLKASRRPGKAAKRLKARLMQGEV